MFNSKKNNIMNKKIFIKFFIFLLLTISFSIMIDGFSYKYYNHKVKNSFDDDDKPAEEVYKNIQVLKGMPAGDLHWVMHFMRASLNVRCSFCHVHDEKTNTWNFESDSIKEKSTAREMILMVKSINTNHFNGNSAVTCFTCHGGHTNPVRTPPLPQVPPPDAQKFDDNLPSADVIIDSYYKALGIKDISDIKNKYSKGTSGLWDGKSYPIEIYQQAPDKFLSVLTAPDGSKTYRGFDGQAGWTKNQQDVQQVEGWQLAILKELADFYSGLDIKKKYSDLRVLGTDTADGSDCYVLRGVIDDKKFDRLYFDRSSGLLVRKTSYARTILGSTPERTEYGNYNSVGGFKSPFRVEFSYLDPWAEVTRNFDEVKYNINMDTISFSMPK